MMEEIKTKRMAECLRELAQDKLAPEFVRQKALRALTGKNDLPPRDGCSYESGGAA
jgi:hypothetical protein